MGAEEIVNQMTLVKIAKYNSENIYKKNIYNLFHTLKDNDGGFVINKRKEGRTTLRRKKKSILYL